MFNQFLTQTVPLLSITMTNKLSLAQIEEFYQEFLDNYDPSPHYSDEEYQEPPCFYTWFEMDTGGGFGEVIDTLGLNPADYVYLPVL